MKDWIIRKLGGKTKAEDAAFRKKCADFSMRYLNGKRGEIIPDCSIYIPFDGDDLCILRGDITVASGRIKEIKVAPWCGNVVLSGLIK